MHKGKEGRGRKCGKEGEEKGQGEGKWTWRGST